MSLLTPRRRFLITAPLALILPAGLLTYLGLLMVNGMERQYDDQVDEAIKNIVWKVRNQAMDKLKNDVTYWFRTTVQEQLSDLIPTFPPPAGCSFTTKKKLDFISRIFFYSADGTFYFFEPARDNGSNLFLWKIVPQNSISFLPWLKNVIDQEIQKLIYDGKLISDENYNYWSYPSESYPTDTLRELVAFMILNIPAEPKYPDVNSFMGTNTLFSMGFTINIDYINHIFFQELLEKLWNDRDIIYPISISDRTDNRKVAQIPELGYANLGENSKYRPLPIPGQVFPGYLIHFSSITGEDILSIAAYGKIVYYCLIVAANVIMIVGVFGMIRNVAKELNLSDLRSDFVARVSHDLRTPLGLIRLYSETLEMGRTKDEQKQKEYLHAITQESERLTRLINNILNFSQIEANKKQYNLKETPIDAIIEDSVETMRYHLGRYGIAIRVELESNLPAIRCDREALLQALYNLLSNAMKYSGAGKEIVVKAFIQEGELVISVIDQGIGIAPEYQKRIFEEFYRVDDPLVRQTGGSGLGLAVVKHIVQGHGGRIEVDSEPGKGSVFSLRLPL